MNFLVITLSGGKIGIFSGDIRKLKDDLAALKPTFFASVPRLYNKFFGAITAKIEKSAVARTLLKLGLKAKTENLMNYNKYDHWLYDKLIFNKIK